MKVSDKLAKVDESFTVTMYDNGFMVEVGGRDSSDDWATAKLLCATFDEVIDLIKEIPTLNRS
jgi:hypothetical protein